MTMSRHGFLHYIAAFNKKWFDAQPKANQDILAQALKEAGRWERKAIVEHDGESVKKIRDSGVQVIEITPAAREQFRQLSLKVHDKFVDNVGRDYLQRLYAEIERASK
jgi:TRAP-type C4-dicarboxylate transport system substrate-binding protein